MIITLDTKDLQELSATAAIALGLIRYRLKLSEKNGWKDEDGTYCIYKAKEVAEILDITERHAKRVLKELEDGGYIRKKTVSGNRVYIYLRDTVAPDSDKNVTLDSDKNVTLTVTKMSPTYRDNNSSKYIESSSSVSPAPDPEHQTEEDEEEENTLYKVIEKTAVRMNLTLSEAEIINILTVIRSKSDQIGHLTAYIRTCIRNQVIKRSAPPSAAKSYAPTYNIEEYESISAIDEED